MELRCEILVLIQTFLLLKLSFAITTSQVLTKDKAECAVLVFGSHEVNKVCPSTDVFKNNGENGARTFDNNFI